MNPHEKIPYQTDSHLKELLKSLGDSITIDSTLPQEITSPIFINKLAEAVDRIQDLPTKSLAYFKLARYVKDLGNIDQYNVFLDKFKAVEKEYVKYLKEHNHDYQTAKTIEAMVTSYTTGSGKTIQAVIHKKHFKKEGTDQGK